MRIRHLEESRMTMHWHEGVVLPFLEDGDGNGVYAYGHVDKAKFAEQVNQYDREAELHPEDYDEKYAYKAENIEYAYARAQWYSDYDWDLIIVDSPTELGATPITMVSR